MSNTLAIVFDFDDTLAPDSTSAFLDACGVDVRDFWSRRVQAHLDDGWDPTPAFLYEMVVESRSRPPGARITRQRLSEFGRGLALFNGVARIFGMLKRHVGRVNPAAELEFYLVTSGIGDMVRQCAISRNFVEVWSSDFHYNADGEIEFPRNLVSFTDKTRYLFQVSKGLIGPAARRDPFAVNRKMPGGTRRVPFEQMIFVGDGYTDVPCFSLVRQYGGLAIGVYNRDAPEKWRRAWGFVEDNRVSNLVPADFGRKAPLHDILMMATESIAKKIALRTASYQG